MKNFAIALASLALLSCTKGKPAREPSDTLPEEATRKFRSCAQDADCVYVQNGCCDCVNGGGELAVNRGKVQAFRAEFICTEKTPCSMVDRIPACGSGAAICSQGLCVYKPL
jgi:hypothetical protein